MDWFIEEWLLASFAFNLLFIPPSIFRQHCVRIEGGDKRSASVLFGKFWRNSLLFFRAYFTVSKIVHSIQIHWRSHLKIPLATVFEPL